MTEKRITRVDIEKAGADGLFVRKWEEGWQIDGSTQPCSNEYLPDARSIETMLFELEKQGFAVWMQDNFHGRALRGIITRVDLIKLPDGWHYKKYCYGWTAKTRPMIDEAKTDDEVKAIVAWCQSKGWNVRQWPGGYRAFKGQPMPVRDRASIMAMRRKVETDLMNGRATVENKSQFDFALDF